LEVLGDVPDNVLNFIELFFNYLNEATSIRVEGVRVEVKGEGYVNTCFLYVTLTNSIIESLTGRLDREIIRRLQALDGELGHDDSIPALREASLLPYQNAYIWRYGEEPIILDRGVELRVNYLGECGQLRPIKEVPLIDVITRLAGLSIIEGFRRLNEGKSLDPIIRVLNALWYLIYGVKPPKNDSSLVVREFSGCSYIKYEVKHQ